MEKHCLKCNTLFKKKPYDSKKYWKVKKFCSVKCSGTLIKKGEKMPEHIRKGMIGVKRSLEARKRISQRLKGHKTSPETRKKISDSEKGKVVSKETREKLSIAFKGKPRIDIRGDKSSAWKGGVTPINKAIRMSLEYKLWRETIYKRDNWTCVWCYQKGGKLNADHIKPFSLYPELRFALDNGRTLCVGCHKKTNTYGSKFRTGL